MSLITKAADFSNRAIGSVIIPIEKTKIMRTLEQKLSEGAFTSLKEKELTLPKLNKLKSHLPGILGLWVTGFYAQSILNNKDIPKERKTPLFINNIFCGAFGTGAGYYVAAAMNKFNEHFVPRFETVLEKQKVSTERIKDLKGALKHSLIPLVAFTFAFRYLAPVIATPLADKVNKYLIKHNLIKDPKPKTNPGLEKFNNWSSNLPKLNLDINK